MYVITIKCSLLHTCSNCKLHSHWMNKLIIKGECWLDHRPTRSMSLKCDVTNLTYFFSKHFHFSLSASSHRRHFLSSCAPCFSEEAGWCCILAQTKACKSRLKICTALNQHWITSWKWMSLSVDFCSSRIARLSVTPEENRRSWKASNSTAFFLKGLKVQIHPLPYQLPHPCLSNPTPVHMHYRRTFPERITPSCVYL